METNTDITQNKMVQDIISLYRTFNVAIKVVAVTEGPSTILVETVPIGQTSIKSIMSLEDELTVTLSAKSVRIGVISGKGTVGIEVATGRQSIVPFVYDVTQTTKMELPILLGKDVTGQDIYRDLTKTPHLLVGGSSGSGKSVFINVLVASLLQSDKDVKFLMIDPKKVELSVYKDLGQKWFVGDTDGPVTDTIMAIESLNKLCVEMDNRYKILQDVKARNIVEAREKGVNMPYIVCIIDEFADLIMTSKEVETPVVRLAQLGRASGIHVCLATQRPSAQVVTGLIKANFPVRIAFRTASNMDSRVILDKAGAQLLIGRGDMLHSSESGLVRIQCPFIDTPEVEAFVKMQSSNAIIVIDEPMVDSKGQEITKEMMTDPIAVQVAKMFYEANQVSATMIMRRLKCGYERAAQLIKVLEAANVISPYENGVSHLQLSYTEFLSQIKRIPA